jgi:signal transduction histidine kinase
MYSILRLLCFFLLLQFSVSHDAQPAAPDSVQILQQAEARVTVRGSTERSYLSLPYHWDRLGFGAGGVVELELAFLLEGEPSTPHALFFPRMGNRYEVWLNGVQLTRGGRIDEAEPDTYADFGKVPRYLSVPPTLLQKTNLLRVRVQADVGRRSGLAPIVVGDEQQVRAMYEQSTAKRVTLSLVVICLALIAAFVCALVWLTQPQRDRLYAYAGLGSVMWALYLSDLLWERSALPWPSWGVLMAVLITGCILYSMAFANRLGYWFVDKQHRAQVWGLRFEHAVPWLIAAGGICAVLALSIGQPRVLTLWYIALISLSCVFVLIYAYAAVRHGDLLMRLMAGILLANLTSGAWDLWHYRISHELGDSAWSRVASMGYSLLLLYIVVTRFRAASAQAKELMQSLESRVAQRESELALSYQQLETLAREQERTSERSRILRNMHDGVGAHISAAIRQVQAGQAGKEEVLTTLRDSLDQLKLSIDSIHLQPGDVGMLLANMRYRLQPRLESSGIALRWQVEELPVIERLDHSAMQQLQFMLFEAFSNVMQHSGAKEMCIKARFDQSQVELEVQDDGRGFDVGATQTRGLASMHSRAHAIGAKLTILSNSSQTSLQLCLPLQVPDTDTPKSA